MIVRFVVPHPAALLLGMVLPLSGQGIERHRDETVPPQVEAIYTRGLEYLAKSQNAEGAWNDQSGTEPAVVGLCVAAFLAHGEEPTTGPYAKTIRKGVDYILRRQNSGNGYIGTTMYNHAFATKALAECYGVVDNPKIAPALKKAVELLLSSQKGNATGGWRYQPDSQDADTTVTGCCMVALFAARNAGIAVPDEAFRRGLGFLAKCQCSDGSVGYMSGYGGKPTLAAIHVLCHSLAKQTQSRGYKSAVEYLKRNLDFREKYYPYYYEYYMSQALFHSDEAAWRDWNTRTTRYFSTIQNREGWFPGNHGQAFNTAGALLSLALNYRYLPIYEK